MLDQDRFERRKMPLSKPIYPKQTYYVIVCVMCVVAAIIFGAAKIIEWMITALVSLAVVIVIMIVLAAKHAVYSATCPYCKRELIVAREVVMFDCPLCKMPIEKGSYDITNAKPLDK